MDDIGKLVLFADVVESGGFSRAAARRGLSHSTVSKHVKSLEAELGVQLLQRTSRTMSLTEEGRLVLETSRRVGADVGALLERLEQLRGDVMGELRVSSLVHVGTHIVQPAIASYLREHPRARVRLSLDDGPLHLSRDGLDLAVRVGLHAEGSLTARKLLDNHVCIVAAPSLLEHHPPPTEPAALASLPTIGYCSDEFDLSTWSYEQDGELRSVRVEPLCRVDDGNALLHLVLSGLGIGYLSAFAAREHLAAGRLVRLLPELRLPPFEPVYVIRRRVEHVPPKLAAFERHLEAAAAACS